MTDAELQKNRFLAMGIDVGIAIAIGVVFGVIGTIIKVFVSDILGALVFAFGALVQCGFILLRDIVMKGNSLGKHLMKIKLVTSAGAPVDMMQSIKRNVVFALPSVTWLIYSIISLIPFLGCFAAVLQFIVGLGVLAFTVWEIITITKDPNGIRWGDQIAGTMVVRQ